MPEIFLILTRTKRGIVINVHRSSCKVSLILVTFNELFNFLDRLKKVCIYRFQNVFLSFPTTRLHCFLSSHWSSYSNVKFQENTSNEDRFISYERTQGFTTKVTVAFPNLANAPQKLGKSFYKQKTPV